MSENTKPSLNTTENGNKTKPLLCEVNYNAYDTWLEPYIGWSFKIFRVTKTKVLFFMDRGFGKKMICSHERCLFNLA